MKFRNGDMVRVIGQHGEALVVGVRRSEVLLQWRTGQWRRTRQWFDDEAVIPADGVASSSKTGTITQERKV